MNTVIRLIIAVSLAVIMACGSITGGTMSIFKHYDTLADTSTGRPIPGAVVVVTMYPSNAAATIYEEDGDVTAAPIVTDKDGFYSFYAGEGRYNLAFHYGETVRIVQDVTDPCGSGIPGPASSGYILLSSYASLAALVTAVGPANGQTVGLDVDATVTANLTIPPNIELLPLNGSIINHGAYTINYAGSTARWPMAQIFSGAGAVTFLAGSVDKQYAVWTGGTGTTLVQDIAAIALTATPRYFVDSIAGDDTANGITPSTAFKTIARLLTETIPANAVIYLARDSYWREELKDLSGKRLTVSTYGTGKMPVLDASDYAVNASFTKSGGYTNLYQIAWTHSLTTADSSISLWENG